ncbi:MAG: hypothetical protein GW875_01690 [Deltaproteobacteria bacterium]|nr:hypothetical protein [Deltaproteobacteria bacterium]NCP01964.1 hypothetical protein [Deltaproteobacteria bacterium]NCP77642.1 hypothetical protein [Desulfuromonadales bacterium]
MRRHALTFFCWLLLSLLLMAAGPVQVPLDGAPALGPADAPVVMVEFIDFQ